MDNQSQGGHGGHGAVGPSGGSPSSIRAGTGTKRKRSGADFESSPGTGAEEDAEGTENRRAPGVKRACNECRQQKLRCDVVQDPFTNCSRCTRLRLECKIESNFKRVGKRSKHAEMEKQIERLKRCLQKAQAQGFAVEDEEELDSPITTSGMYSTPATKNSQSFMGSDEAVSSLLHLKQGGSYPTSRIAYELEGVGLTEDSVNSLFSEFFGCYHPYLPFLNQGQSPEQYNQQHPLLFWSIVAVAARRYAPDTRLLAQLSVPLSRLLWQTVGEVPNNHYVVKALCLLCMWPLPTSTTSTDPTHILCGVMMKAATGIGLHRPSHSQDFSRVSVDLNKEQLHDRVTTWAVCNIVAQSIGTGYGQPASTLYGWTLAIRPGEDGPFTLSAELEARLQIERFCDKVSKEMYSNASDPRGVAGDELRSLLTRVYKREYGELSVSILSQQSLSPIVNLHLKAAGLHLRLAAFFDSYSTPGYMDDLLGLWRAAVAFLDLVFELESPTAENISPGFLRYATNYILQMMYAACFTLLKMLSSFFAAEIDFEKGRQLFHRTIQAIRTMSVVNNDLPWRLAEMMVQMWNGARVESRSQNAQKTALDGSLELKVRCRMSMSLVFDSIWRWREDFQAQGRGNIEAALKNPTDPDSAADSSASSAHLEISLIASNHGLRTSMQQQSNLQSGMMGLGITGANGLGNAYGESNYEVFDPLNWMLDGLVDFPYSYAAVQGLEAQGI